MADNNRSPLQDAGAMGMYLLVAALGMLFAGSVVGYLTIRSAHQPWPPPGFPVLPRSLWLSTLCILLCSVTIQRAVQPSAKKAAKKVSGTFCRNGPKGAAHKRFLTPFSHAPCGATWPSRWHWASPFSPCKHSPGGKWSARFSSRRRTSAPI